MLKLIKRQEKKQRQQMAKLRKLQHRIKITFESPQDCNAIGPGMLGQGYGVCEDESGLTPGQIAYRMRLAREIYGLPKGVGFARAYRRGDSDLAKLVLKQFLPAVRATLLEDLPKARKHPTPKMSPHQEELGPTVDEAIKKLGNAA